MQALNDSGIGTVGGTLVVPTIADELKSQGAISTESIGIYYAPSQHKRTHHDSHSLTKSVIFSYL